MVRTVIALPCLALLACGGENRAPSLALLADQQVVVGETLRFIVTGDDPDGDRLSFDSDGLPDDAQLTPRSREEAVIVWSPLITDTQPGGRRYEVTVTADDGRGGSARQTVGIVVYPTFGVPAFTLPAGVVLNLAEDDDLALLVEVKDDDSTALSLTMTEGPTGAKLQEADTAKSAYFYWKPDDLQRTVAVHRAIFQATDESHGPVSHTLTIVLLNAEKQSGCEGTPPTVGHQPSPDQNSDGDVSIVATASDAQSQVESMTLHWTTGDPDGTYASVPFTRDDPNGDGWSAQLSPSIAGNGTLVSYYFTATDNDDPTGIACDREGRYPKSGWFTTAVYPTGTSSTTCVDDRAEPDSDAFAAPTLAPGSYAGRRICGDDYDFAKVDAATGTTVVASLTWNPAHGDLSLRLVDAFDTALAIADASGEGRLNVSYDVADGDAVHVEVTSTNIGARLAYNLELAVETTKCTDDDAEPDSPATAQPLATGSELAQKVCPGDSDWFMVNAAPDAPVRIELAFDHRYGDLDLDVLLPDGTTVVAQSATEASLEVVDLVPEQAGTFLVRVYGIPGATNGYTLDVTATSATCTADGLGDNTSSDTAAALFQGVYEGFVTCGSEPDWFVVEVNGGELVDVLTLAEGEPVSIELYEDPLGAPVASNSSDGSGFADVSWTRTSAGKLWYTVEPLAENATYSLLQEITDPAGACQPDRLEPNSSSLPVPIDEGVTTWLRLCDQGDVDAFTIEVEAFTTLVALTAHATGEQFTDLQVLGPSGTVLWQVEDVGDGAYIEEVAEEAGTYTILVRPFDVSAGLGYDLAVFRD